MTLNGPALLVLAPAVQQIEHRILALRAVVVGRRVDVGAAPRAGHGREVALLAHRPVRHVFHARILGVGGRLRHLDRAVVEARSEKRPGRRIGDHGAVNRQRVVVEADHLRRGGHVPQAVRRLGHVEALPDAHPDLLGVRRGDPERDPVVGVDARVRRARDVQRAREAVARPAVPMRSELPTRRRRLPVPRTRSALSQVSSQFSDVVRRWLARTSLHVVTMRHGWPSGWTLHGRVAARSPIAATRRTARPAWRSGASPLR